jgi:hypothetical protein
MPKSRSREGAIDDQPDCVVVGCPFKAYSTIKSRKCWAHANGVPLTLEGVGKCVSVEPSTALVLVPKAA